MQPETLLVFARRPVPGQVKTRLCPPLTGVEAARVHQICLQAVIEGAHSIDEVGLILVGTPDGAEASFGELSQGRPLCVSHQGPGTLGERLERGARKALHAGATRVVILGTDSPHMPAGSIQSAIERLDHADVVMGPTEDGGYYLIAIRDDPGRLFQSIDWGKEQVADQTRAQVKLHNWRLSELPPSYDIDQWADLVRVSREPLTGFLSASVIDQLRRIIDTVQARQILRRPGWPSRSPVARIAPMSNTATLRRRLNENLSRIRERIDAAVSRGGRGDPIDIVIVTKTAGMDIVRTLAEMRIEPLAESRVQELARKAAMISESVKRQALLASSDSREMTKPTWHMVGHLQRNKVAPLLEWVDLIHSLDSLRLAEEIETQAAKRSQKVRVLLQVNTADESGKSGVAVGAALHLADQMRSLSHLELCGLMTMGPQNATEERLKLVFHRTRELFDEIKTHRHTGPAFQTLSMGMSEDFEIAVECGATMVRLGRVVFEGIEVNPDGVEHMQTGCPGV